MPLGKFLTAFYTSFKDVMLKTEEFVAAIEEAQKVRKQRDSNKVGQTSLLSFINGNGVDTISLLHAVAWSMAT